MHTPSINSHIHLPDEMLVKGTVRGDDRLYAELMRRYVRSVFGFIAARVGNEQAEKLTQETFYAFWKELHSQSRTRKLRRKLFEFAELAVRGELHAEHKFSLRDAPSFSLIALADSLREPASRLYDAPRIIRNDLQETLARIMPALAAGRSITRALMARTSRLKLAAPQS
jgi:DNA-directed RNA polymerase specialized sigma24 family protein